MKTKVKQAEVSINKLRADKLAADAKAREAAEAFEKSNADPLDETTPEFMAFDSASKESDALAESLQKATETLARLKGHSSPAGPGPNTDDPTNKMRGDDFLDQAVEALKAASVGRRVFETEATKALMESGVLIGAAEFGQVELGKAYDRDEIKALIGTGNATSGASNLLTPDRLPLVDLVPSRPTRMIDLVSKGTTDSKSIEYPVLVQRGMAAGYVPDPVTAAAIGSGNPAVTPEQAGRKPETSLVWDIRSATVKTIASWIPVHRNMMDDAPYLESMIDAYLRDELEQRMDQDIATGTGAGESFKGLLNTDGIGGVVYGSGSIIDSAHRAMTVVRLQQEEPTAYALHPTTWENIRLLRAGKILVDAGDPDAEPPVDPTYEPTGEYLFGRPSQAGDSTLWGKPVVTTAAIPQGTILTGDFAKAMLWIRTGVRVLASDSHEDFFTRNLVALLAEIRAAFGVIKPLAFAKATQS
jgi:HK97 family phage major capsid protein